MEERIKNADICTTSYNIPCIIVQIAVRQLTYIGKICCREGSHIQTLLLTAWCDHRKNVGRPLLSSKKYLIHNLRFIISSVDNGRSLSTWVHHTLDSLYWHALLQMIDRPESSAPYSPLNPLEEDISSNPPPPEYWNTPPPSSSSPSSSLLHPPRDQHGPPPSAFGVITLNTTRPISFEKKTCNSSSPITSSA